MQQVFGCCSTRPLPEPQQIQDVSCNRENWHQATQEFANKPWYAHHRRLGIGLAALTIVVVPFI